MIKTLQTLKLAVMVFLVASLVVACSNKNTGANTTPKGNENTPAAPATGEVGEEKAADEPIVLGFSQIGAESGWRTAETESIKETFGNDPQFELKFSDAQQKQENQIKAIRSFIAQKVDVIALAPVVESGWETVLREAKDAGIPVFLLDRGVSEESQDLYTSFIGSDFILEGKYAAKVIIDHFGADAEVNIAELQGTVGASAANDRKEGFEQGIAAAPGYKIIKSQTGDFTRAKGKEVMEAFLQTDAENIDVVYAHNDDMALGAIQAIEEAGLKPGEDIFILSIDGTKAAFEAIAEGKMNAVIECNPLLGPDLKQAILDYKAGKELPKWIKAVDGVFVGQEAVDALPNRKY